MFEYMDYLMEEERLKIAEMVESLKENCGHSQESMLNKTFMEICNQDPLLEEAFIELQSVSNQESITLTLFTQESAGSSQSQCQSMEIARRVSELNNGPNPHQSSCADLDFNESSITGKWEQESCGSSKLELVKPSRKFTPRVLKTEPQIRALEGAFVRDPAISKPTLDKLLRTTGLTSKQIRRWFQYRRKKGSHQKLRPGLSLLRLSNNFAAHVK